MKLAGVSGVLVLFVCSGCGSGDQGATPNDASAPSDVKAGTSGCSLVAGPAPAGAARSAGYSGTDSAFLGLFDVPCSAPGDCTAPCVTAGGSMSSCASSSLCLADPLADGGTRCIPPAYWFKTSQALTAADADSAAAAIVVVDTPYHDALMLTDFGLSVPDDASIVGIQFDLQHASDDGETIDAAVQVLRNGTAVGTDRSAMGSWPRALANVTYGGKSDTWGVAWAPGDVRSTGFGVAITPKFTATKGNDHAYLNSVRATVYYTTPCD